MGICKICGTPLQPGKINTLAAGTSDKCICEACSTQVKNLIKRTDPTTVAAARVYFEQRRLRTTDPEVRDYLARLCGGDAAGIGSLPAPKPLEDDWGAGTEKPSSSFVGIGGLSSSFWITCLKVTLAVSFFAIILSGVIYAFTSGVFGLLILIAAVLLAFASIAGGMVLLSIAEDVSTIRYWISHNKTDREQEQTNASGHTHEK